TGRSFNKGEWALTYDDGPSDATTPTIVNDLTNAGWHATFFWLAKNVSKKKNRKSVEAALASKMKMSLASHSYTHANMPKQGSSSRDKEIRQSKGVLEEAFSDAQGNDVTLNFFRLPYGAGTKDADIKKRITSAGMEHFFWNVDTLDWKNQTPQQIYDRTKKQMDSQGRGIILFHDIHKRTVETTKLMIKNLKGRINVIRLENGNGVGTANTGLGSAPAPSPTPTPAPAPVVTPKLKLPGDIMIHQNIKNLYVRVAGEGTQPCGLVHKGQTVQAISTDSSGWYMIDTTTLRSALGRPDVLTPTEPGKPVCGRYAFVTFKPKFVCAANSSRICP
ncbi:MAG: polysaccharide deacetylase family protein, partial [Pseudomonadota bacterium]